MTSFVDFPTTPREMTSIGLESAETAVKPPGKIKTVHLQLKPPQCVQEILFDGRKAGEILSELYPEDPERIQLQACFGEPQVETKFYIPNKKARQEKKEPYPYTNSLIPASTELVEIAENLELWKYDIKDFIMNGHRPMRADPTKPEVWQKFNASWQDNNIDVGTGLLQVPKAKKNQ